MSDLLVLKKRLQNEKDPHGSHFRKLLQQGLKSCTSPQDARWLYDLIEGNHQMQDLRDQALEICFQQSRIFFHQRKISYGYLFWLAQTVTNPLRKRWAAEACLQTATTIEQVNDFLFTYARPDIYWRVFIALAENERQIRHAVKYSPKRTKGYAKSIEAIMWFKKGKMVPYELPCLK